MTGGLQTINDSQTTSWQAFLHLLKGYVGPGCLGLPWAVTQLGVRFGFIACLLLGYLTSYNAWTVVELKRQLQAERRESTNAEAIITYPNIVGWLYGTKFERCSRICICVQQLAICTVFLSFVGANLHAVLEASFDMTLSHGVVISAVLPAVLALSLLRNLRTLAPVMVAGTAMILVAFALLIVVMAEQWPSRPVHPDISIHFATTPLALCAILYAYEGICLVLPIESSMADPNQFARVFWTAMACSALLYTVLSITAVLVFGPVTSGSLTAFLLDQYAHDAKMKHLLLAMNAFVSVSVLLTYPLQLVPALELIDEVRKPLCTFCRKRRMPVSDGMEVEYYEGSFIDMDEQSSAPENQGSLGRREDDRTCTKDDEERETAQDGLMRMTEHLSPDSFRSEDSEGYEPIPNDDAVNFRTRTCLVLATYLVAVLVPNIEILISLAGAVAGSCMALCMPPLLQIAAGKRFHKDSHRLDMYRSYGLVVVALVFMSVGTVAALMDIAHIYVG